MSQTYKYHVQNIGLGDLTFFCGNILLLHNLLPDFGDR